MSKKVFILSVLRWVNIHFSLLFSCLARSRRNLALHSEDGGDDQGDCRLRVLQVLAKIDLLTTEVRENKDTKIY